jgi:hypothetical protein
VALILRTNCSVHLRTCNVDLTMTCNVDLRMTCNVDLRTTCSIDFKEDLWH